jgi:ankyrin repeat protein
MPFSDLPWEILLEIAYQLDDAGINALCRTNRQIYGFLNGYLYRRDMTRCWPWLPSRSLSWAVRKGEEAQGTVQQAIAVGRHLDPIPERIYEIYHLALLDSAAQGHTRLVELLLNVEGVNPNYADPDFGCYGKNALTLAAERGHVSTTKFLLATPGVDPNITVLTSPNLYLHILGYLAYYRTPSHPHYHTTVIKLFLDHPDIDPNCDCDKDGRSLLMLAIMKPDVVKLLLHREGIDVNKQDNNGYTALSHAVQCVMRRSGFEPAKLLLDRDDINVNLRDRNGRTPLFLACRLSDVSMVDLLLKKEGIDPNAMDIHGCTPLGTLCYLHLSIQHTCAYGTYGSQPAHIEGRRAGLTHLENVAKVRLLLSHPDTDSNPVDTNGVSLLSHVILNVTPVYGWQMELLLRTAGATQRCIQYCQTPGSSQTSSLRARLAHDHFLLATKHFQGSLLSLQTARRMSSYH